MASCKTQSFCFLSRLTERVKKKFLIYLKTFHRTLNSNLPNKQPLVSVIIATHNRYPLLKRAIDSVLAQTYKHIEIIVINDGSDDPRYYENKWPGIIIVHLPRNSREIFGHSAPGYIRNYGLKLASGQYVAILDDDDIWLPEKLQTQLKQMRDLGFEMSCTEAYAAEDTYNKNQTYPLYNGEYYFDILKKKLGFNNSLPDVFEHEFIKKHDCIINVSVVVSMRLILKVGYFTNNERAEDWEYWLRCLRLSPCLYIKTPLLIVVLNTSIYGKRSLATIPSR